MTRKDNSSERGQAIVLVAVAFVVLLGFTALAVDGSMVYSDRRFAQNASDAASLAGGSDAAIILENDYVDFYNWNCGSANITSAENAAKAAAVSRAADNAFTIDYDINDAYDQGVDDGGVTTQCVVDTSGSWDEKYIDVHTRITSKTDTAFAHFVFGGEMLNTVDAVTRVRPRSPLAYGHAIVALNPDACSGQQNGAGFHGTADVLVDGGGIYSNGCLQGDGTIDVDVDDGTINYAGEYIPGGNFDPAPQPVGDTIPPDAYSIDAPDCSHIDAHNWTTTNDFENAASSVGGLDPGLHCVEVPSPGPNTQVVFNGGTVRGIGVTIYLVNVGIRINGNVEVTLEAPLETPDPAPAVAGLLFYVGNNRDVDLSGTSDSDYTGTILAPLSNVTILGTAGADAFHSQIIGWNVEAGGTSDLYVLFEGGEQGEKPTSLELAR